VAVTVQQQKRPPIWRNTTILKWVAQVAFLLVLIALALIVVPQVQDNLRDRGLTYGWSWLRVQLGFLIGEGIDPDPDTGARTILVGIVNTLRVTVSGIVAATFLGTVIGVGRLSSNWIVNKLATVYIETIRNIPLLLQMFFWFAVVQILIPLSQTDPDSLEVGQYWFATTRKGIGLPWIQPWGGFYQWLVFVILGAIAGYFVHKRLFKKREEEGGETYPNLSAFGVLLAFSVVGWFAHPMFSWLGHVFEFLGDVVGAIPTIGLQLALAAVAIYLGFWWINRFLDERRTPAGLAKLTDDDWFRMILAGFLAVAAAGFFMATPALSERALEIGEDFFTQWAAPKFDSTTNVVAVPITEIEAQLAAGATLESIANELGVAPKKLVDGLTAGVVSDLDNALRSGELTAAQVAEELETIQDRGNMPLRWSRPAVEGTRFLNLSDTTGMNITPSFFAVWVAVTLYTASFIAEIVRAGILAVSKGQTEAAGALGLTRAQSLRHVVLPQAFRIIFPPLGNQYLNLFKNTSLGIAVAYPEIVSVGITTSNQTGQTLPVILIWMGFFLTGSLVLSSIVNFYNRRLALVER
jgi:His/Glu/Gln/Arg/opine family amino acid ABC transporter permease subunit